MGRRWSGVAMPLLSTLAALVILVHSEESAERELRPHTSPRLSEPGAPDYHQSWRTVDMPLLQQAGETEEWRVDMPSEEPPKRRRPGRKRKRRPQHDIHSQDLHAEEHRVYGRSPDNESEPPEQPRRRRKRPDVGNENSWNKDTEDEKRLPRRRGHRRKRPVLVVETEENGKSPEQAVSAETSDKQYVIDIIAQQASEHSDRVDNVDNKQDITFEKSNWYEESEKDGRTIIEDTSKLNDEIVDIQVKQVDEIPHNEKQDKSYRVPYAVARKQDQAPTGDKSIIIKELLKQSGGLSLSEVLQQRNLSLADLLDGKQTAISALRSDTVAVLSEENYKDGGEASQKVNNVYSEIKEETKDFSSGDETTTTNISNDDLQENHFVNPISRPTSDLNKDNKNQSSIEAQNKSNQTKSSLRRRLQPSGVRKNIRNRIRNPHIESTTLRIRPQYFLSTKLPRVTTTTSQPTSLQEEDNFVDFEAVSTKESDVEIASSPNTEIPTKMEYSTITITRTEKRPTIEKLGETLDETEFNNSNVEKDKISILSTRPTIATMISEIRRQAQNNRQNKKKIQSKSKIPQNAEVIDVKDMFGLANLVSASEFITKTQTTTTDLPDLFTDSGYVDHENIAPDKKQKEEQTIIQSVKKVSPKPPKYTNVRQRILTSVRNIVPVITTEESAKEEILEVFNDINGGARLAKILSERNMTINELVKHRERGSSQTHLADIFHNASREPSPPEPFLSKSLIEPISKETYPLRALLEANHHDPPLKPATPNSYAAQYTNIPLIVEYGRNIHENGENLGIMSLFNEISKVNSKIANVKTDSKGAAYFTSVMNTNTTEDNFREGKSMMTDSQAASVSSMVSDINASDDYLQDRDGIIARQVKPTTTRARTLERDIDGDGLIVLQDLQNLNEEDNTVEAVNQKLKVLTRDSPRSVGFFSQFPSGVRSATILSAAIAVATMIVFLVAYIGYKWRQRRKSFRKDSFRDVKIPTPVFENRKSHRNCSMRSISPMLASSNGFSLSTIDSQTGKESPDYMWDTLHKPFQ